MCCYIIWLKDIQSCLNYNGVHSTLSLIVLYFSLSAAISLSINQICRYIFMSNLINTIISPSNRVGNRFWNNWLFWSILKTKSFLWFRHKETRRDPFQYHCQALYIIVFNLNHLCCLCLGHALSGVWKVYVGIQSKKMLFFIEDPLFYKSKP